MSVLEWRCIEILIKTFVKGKNGLINSAFRVFVNKLSKEKIETIFMKNIKCYNKNQSLFSFIINFFF